MSKVNFDAVKSVDINNSSYAGELALPYIRPAILAANSIREGLITLKEGVKDKAVMKKLSGGTLIAAGCDFDSTSGSMDVDEVTLEVTDLMVNEQLCKRDFRRDWEALQTGRGFRNTRIPPNFEAFLFQHLGLKVSEQVELNMWQGNYDLDGSSGGSAVVTAIDGVCKKIVDGTPGYEQTVSGAFTPDAEAATGILTHLDSLVGGMPDAIQGDPNTVIYMSRKSLFLVHRAMAGIAVTSGGYSPTFVGDARPTSYLGYTIVVPAGFPNDTLVASRVDNLYFGTDLTSDFTEAIAVDMTKTSASLNYRVAMHFSAGVAIADLGSLGVIRRAD